MTQREVRDITFAQLAVDLNCAPETLKGAQDALVFVEAGDNPGRRPFPRGDSHFEMVGAGRSIVVFATPDILGTAQKLLEGKPRDEVFSMPFVRGLSHYFLPDLARIAPLPAPESLSFEMVERGGIPRLYELEGFRNAVQYDSSHLRPDVLAVLAKDAGRVVGVAGASVDCARMWQIGIDVLPEYRRRGVAAYIVNRLALEILERGFVPYYGTSSANVASQRVAYRAGFEATWVCAYSGLFGGIATSPTG